MKKCLSNNVSTLNYIYLLQEREFIKTSESVFKVGKTQQINHKRFKQYPKGSVLLFQMKCNNCHDSEKQILTEFKLKFIQRTDIGTEYFEGNESIMIDIIYQTIKSVSESVVVIQPRVFACSNCHFLSHNKKDYTRHILTLKHLNGDKPMTNNSILFSKNTVHICDCGKEYKYRQGLSIHKKQCIKTTNLKPVTNITNISPELIIEVVKTNSELQKQILHNYVKILDNEVKIQYYNNIS